MIKYETDSRLIQQGQIFVAIKGNTVDGHDYINDAIKNGAIKIICEKDINSTVDYEIVDSCDEYIKDKLVEEYSNNLQDLNILGVTGTNGKTTTCYLTYQMLNLLNVNAAYIGTIGFYHKDLFIELNNTTPDILTLYKLLYKAKEDLKCTHIVMEVSSHALAFDRLAGIKINTGAFTNLTQDHLDYHKTMENYLNDKLKIIDYMAENGTFIVNSDDLYSKYFTNKYPTSLTLGNNGDYKINNYDITAAMIKLDFEFDNNNYDTNINLTSKFNIYNYLTALALVNNSGFSINEILNISKNIVPPKGRCETILINGGYAVVDYAHTPDAVEKVITAYNELKTKRVITIIGCGGDRDPNKRPIMGKVASDLSDYVIFTNDNPRTENPENIMKDILKGVTKTNYEVIFDRPEAIKKAIDIMNSEDIILILGKGHEDYQIIGHKKHHLDDAEEVKKWI